MEARCPLAQRTNNLDSAIADFDWVIERLARSQDEVERRVAAGAYWNRGQCYQLKGDAPRAEADKKDALSRDPRLAAQRSGF